MKGLLEKYSEALSLCLEFLPKKSNKKSENEKIRKIQSLVGQISLHEKDFDLSDSEQEGLYEFIEWVGLNFKATPRGWEPSKNKKDSNVYQTKELLHIWIEKVNL